MQFSESTAIYLQIADYVCERILLKEWPPGSRIPSVRELAIQLEVNPNTIMRTYDFLQQQAIIFNQRGIGFFASEDAPEQASRYRKKLFIEKDLPQFYRNLYLLGMSIEEVQTGFETFKQQMYENK